MKALGDWRLEDLITKLLRVGIWVSSTVVILGGILFLIHQGHIPVKYHIFVGEPKELTEIFTIEELAIEGRPSAIIQLGVLLLIATPIAKVLLCGLVFLSRRDWIYLLICLISAAILLLSLLGVFVP